MTDSQIKTYTYATIIGSALLAILLIVAFGWNQLKPWDEGDLVVHHELLGTYGDIVGGVIGVILSGLAAILAYHAFTTQQEITKTTDKHQQDESKLSRFNSLFFELLRLYKEQREALNSQLPTTATTQNHFEEKQKVLYSAFQTTASRKFKFTAHWETAKKCILILEINNRQRNNDPIMVPFRVFTPMDHYNFLKSLLKEIFDYSNFRKYNAGSNLSYETPSINVGLEATVIRASISSDKPLRIIHPDWV